MMRYLPATFGTLMLMVSTQSLAAQTTTAKLRGDINGDGQITSVDALAVLSYTVGKSLPADYKPLPNGDNNGDGQVTAVDALIALSFIVGKDVSQFPINKPLQTTATVEISPASAIVLVGQDAQLTATPRDSSGAAMEAAVTWKSSDEAIATVDANGKVTAKALGIAIITATADGKSSSISVAGDQIADGSVAAGPYHSCAITATGSAICWGRNSNGQLGDGTKVDRTTPVTVSGAQKWKAITVAENSTCALNTAGAAYCWGYGGSGTLGDGTTGDATTGSRYVPTAVSGGRVYQAISARHSHVFAITDAGALYGWGVNDGTLGDGTTTLRLVPTALVTPAGLVFKTVSAGYGHAVALTTTGAAYAWGGNLYGQLGNGASSSTPESKPVAVSGNITFRSIAAGSIGTYGLTTDGKAYWWGAGSFAALAENKTTPTLVPGNITFRSIHTGSSEFVGISGAGQVYTWNGAATGPAIAANGRLFRTLAVGEKHTVAAAFDGSLWAWGYNDVGQLGDGSTTQFREEPGLVGSTLPASRVTVTAGDAALMFRSATATMTVTLARLGGFTGDVDLSFEPLPGITGSFEPARLTGAATTSTLTIRTSATAPTGIAAAQIRVRPAGRLDQFTSAAVAVSGSTIGQGMVTAGGTLCGLTTAGKAYCVNGATLPTEEPKNLFQAVPGGKTFATISSGNLGICGLTPEGAAYCWGPSAIQLGVTSSENPVLTPLPVSGGLTFRTIDVGDQRICAVTTGGDAYCWGSMISGGYVSTPTLVPGGIKFYSVDANGFSAVGLATDGTPYSWADGTAPTKLSATLKFVALESGGQAFGGLTADGSVYMWGTGYLGSDFAGEQGQTFQTPTKVADLKPLRSLSMGINGTGGIDRNGTIWWWGEYMLKDATIDQCLQGITCGTYLRSKTPRSFTLTGPAVQLSVTGGHAAALSSTGIMYAWGGNLGGQLGDGTKTSRDYPFAQDQSYILEGLNSPIWIEPGKSTTLQIRVTRRGGFTTTGVGFPGDIALTVSGTLPTGVTATISPSTLGPDATTATITITASADAAPGEAALNINAKSPGIPDQSAPLSAVIPKPIPATGLNLVCSPANFGPKDYFGYYCMNNGVLAPGKWAIKPLHTPVGGSTWWVEDTYEVCAQWDATNGKSRVRFKGSFGAAAKSYDGDWGILVKKDGTPEPQAGSTWLLFTSAMDAQLRGMNYKSAYGDGSKPTDGIPSGQSPFLNYNFQKKACPW